MAAKRFHEESGSDPDQPDEKRIRGRPSLMSVFGEVLTGNFVENFCTTLEPMLRKVVVEEVEKGIRKCRFTKSPSFRIQAPEPSTMRLNFTKNLSLPIFTGTKIVNDENKPLQLIIEDTSGDNQNILRALSLSLKVEIIVLDGDFPGGDRENWSTEEFDNSIVKERAGKRPLLAGDVHVTMRGGAAVIGDIEFTDNSSWIRSRNFRLGARVVPDSCKEFRIREAITEAFVVKDHRGELYKKHYPPKLDDDVWRLEKIGKDGAFHKKLASINVNSVQDFLKLSIVDPAKLKNILGVGMSDRMWESTIKHARTCTLGNKLYIYRGSHFTMTLNPICMVVKVKINGQTYATPPELSPIRTYLEELVRQAYANWDSLEVVDEVLNETSLLTQGEQIVEQYPNHEVTMAIPFQQLGNPADTSMGVGYTDVGCSHWQMNPSYHGIPFDHSSVHCYITRSSSEGDGTSSSGAPFPNGS